jgi:hypothetical protein
MRYDISAWNFRAVPKTDYHKDLIVYAKKPIITFLETFTLERFREQAVTMTGKELFAEYKLWRTSTSQSSDCSLNEGSFMKKIHLDGDLPAMALQKKARTSAGYKYDINLKLMRSHFLMDNLMETAAGTFVERGATA